MNGITIPRRLDENNLLEPITFGLNEIKRYVDNHACGLCNSWLLAMPAPNNLYYAWCPIHGKLIESQIIGEYQRLQTDESRYIGRRELRKPSGKSPEEIKRELGF